MARVQGELIRLVNIGEASLNDRLGSASGNALSSSLQQQRKIVAESYEEDFEEETVDFKVMTVDRYKQTHNGRHPEADGLTVVKRKVTGRSDPVDCVYIREQHTEEWKVKIGSKKANALRETHAGPQIRENQAEIKFNLLRGASSGHNILHGATVTEADIHAIADVTDPPPGDAGDADGNDSDHMSVEDEDDDLMSSIIGGGGFQPSKHRVAPKPVAKPHAKSKLKPTGAKLPTSSASNSAPSSSSSSREPGQQALLVTSVLIEMPPFK